MDFSFTPEQEAARREYDKFFEEVMKDAPDHWMGTLDDLFMTEDGAQFHRNVASKMAERGWLTLPWPEEYGGQGKGAVDLFILMESQHSHGAPGLQAHAVTMLGGSIIQFGTDEQKKRLLPQLGSGKIKVAQGWSEPNAGSDIASLTTRAVEDGDEFIINGQKTWSSGARHADWYYLPARTDATLRRHRGLSYFLIEDLNAPGITRRPVYSMNGQYFWDEVFFDDVRIPRRNLIGEIGQGWRVILHDAEQERLEQPVFIGEAQYHFRQLLDYCKETKRDGVLLSKNPIIRHRLADLAIDIELARDMMYWMAAVVDKGEMAPQYISVAIVVMHSVQGKLGRLGIDALGHWGEVKYGSKWARMKGRFEMLYQTSTAWAIPAGGAMVMKNEGARWGLGFPKVY